MANTHRLTPEKSLWRFCTYIALTVLATVFAIVAAFFYLHQQNLNQYLSKSLITGKILFSTERAQPSLPLDVLKQRAKTLLEHPDYNAITLIDQNTTVLFSLGITLTKNDIKTLQSGKKKWRSGRNLYVAQTIETHTGAQASLVVAHDTNYIQLVNLEFIFVLFLALTATGVVAVILYQKLNRQIFKPLIRTVRILESQNKNGDISRIEQQQPGVFSDLFKQINRAFSIMMEKQTDLKKNINNATLELKESLETVEIHNIDLDIARKKAIELNKLKSEFLKKTSQDLRAPLSGILGFSELLKKTYLTAEQKDYLGTIEDSTKGMLTIVNDIHDFSRLENGNLQIEKKPMNLRRTVEEALTMQAPLAAERDVSLHSIFDTDIPQSLLGDPLRIQQVITNLLLNIIKFEHNSYIEIYVKIQRSNKNEIQLNIGIRSDGRCPLDFDKKLLTKEDNSDTTKNFYSGSDMGYSIARGIVDHMQGSISFENREQFVQFNTSLTVGVDQQANQPIKFIDPSYQINAVVYCRGEQSYREVTSRLVELSINNQRAERFSEILNIAERMQQQSVKHSRYMPIAVIEAQTSQQTLDKIVLTETLKTLTTEYNIPCVLIAPTGQQESLEKTLTGMNVFIIPHPLATPKLKKALLEQLGIVRLKTGELSKQEASKCKAIRVLLVDDNPANVKLAVALLKNFNVDITKAFNGKEALDLFAQKDFDLVFMDIQLPDINGYEVTAQMRASETSGKRTPIVALTAHNVEEDKMQLLLTGMDDFVGKPLTQRDIGLVLDRWVIHNRGRTVTQSIPPALSPIKKVIADKHSTQDTSKLGPVSIQDCLNLTKNDAELARDMLNMLIASIKTERADMESALANNEHEKLYELVHRLHGACCYCGVPRLKKICRHLDQQLKDKKTENIHLETTNLFSAMDELEQWQEEHDIDILFEET